MNAQLHSSYVYVHVREFFYLWPFIYDQPINYNLNAMRSHRKHWTNWILYFRIQCTAHCVHTHYGPSKQALDVDVTWNTNQWTSSWKLFVWNTHVFSSSKNETTKTPMNMGTLTHTRTVNTVHTAYSSSAWLIVNNNNKWKRSIDRPSVCIQIGNR